MKRLLVLGAAIALALPASMAAGSEAPRSNAAAPLFAGGGTPLSNGAFFPGTAIYNGEDENGKPSYIGQAYQIEQGTDLQFVNLDHADLSNAHQIRSFARKRGRPLFESKRLEQPGQQALVVTSHLKPGVYDYYCPVHTAMYGLIEVTPN